MPFTTGESFGEHRFDHDHEALAAAQARVRALEAALREMLATFTIVRRGTIYVADMPRPSLEDGYEAQERARAALDTPSAPTPGPC